MFNNLYAAANEIRTLLMPFAFVLCVIGIGEMGWRAGSDPRAVLGALLKCIIIVTLIAGYPDIMKGGQKAFMELRNEFTNARDAKFVQLLRSRVENQPSDSLANIGKIVPAAIGYFFQGIGRFMLLVLRFFQEFAIAGSHCHFAALDWISLLFLHAIARCAFRGHFFDRAALARGDLPCGHHDSTHQ